MQPSTSENNASSSGKIFQDDPDAIAKLEQKLVGLKKEQAYWKSLKKLPRTYQHDEPDGAKRCYMLPSITTNIREVNKKIQKIKARQDAGVTLERKTVFVGGGKHFKYVEVPKID